MVCESMTLLLLLDISGGPKTHRVFNMFTKQLDRTLASEGTSASEQLHLSIVCLFKYEPVNLCVCGVYGCVVFLFVCGSLGEGRRSRHENRSCVKNSMGALGSAASPQHCAGLLECRPLLGCK